MISCIILKINVLCIEAKQGGNVPFFQKKLYFCKTILRGRAVVARRAHNPEVAGSSPAPATKVMAL